MELLTRDAKVNEANIFGYVGFMARLHSFDHALAYYHARAQPPSRTLKGQSPHQALGAAIAAGWSGAPQVDPLALRVAFSGLKPPP